MKIIGLSGGIASGKSTISKMLKDMGIPVIDGDYIAHSIINRSGPVLDKVVEAFGIEVLNIDNTLNRKKLGSLVFSSKNNLEKLNSITHPAIKMQIIDCINTYKNTGQKCCVVDGALLMEGIFKDIVNILILVFVNGEIQIKRLMERNLIGNEEAINRINSQMPFEEKKIYADYVIDNSYDVEYTRSQLNKIMNEILSLEDWND
jgi:dephospho-CoA kinase